MDAEKMLDLQMKLKQDNDEMLSSLNDLNNWEQEIKEKEKYLLEGEPKKNYPIRNNVLKSIKKNFPYSNKDKNVNSISQKIKGDDYKAWESYDDKKECEEIEKNEKENEKKVEKIADDLIKKSEQIKERGNKDFKIGNFAKSIESYSQAILLTPQNPLLYSNRALAYIKLSKWSEAEKDCDAALEIDTQLVKAIMRRGLTRFEQGKLKGAQEDFIKVIKLEPSNRQSREELSKIQKLIEEKRRMADKEGYLSAVHKEPHEISEKPLKRIQITEVGSIKTKNPSKSHKPCLSNFDAVFNKQNQYEGSNRSKEDFESVKNDEDDSNLLNGKLLLPGQASKSVKITEINTEEKNENKKAEGDREGVKISSVNNKLDSNSSICPTKTQSNDIPYKPSDVNHLTTEYKCDRTVSPFQFQLDWRELKDDEDAFYHYLKSINPASYRQMLGEFFDASIFSKIINVLNNFYIRDGLDCYPVLFYMCNVKRFCMIVMFASHQEKKVLAKIFTTIRESKRYTTSEIDNLTSLYH